jgi:hypothetical protein
MAEHRRGGRPDLLRRQFGHFVNRPRILVVIRRCGGNMRIWTIPVLLLLSAAAPADQNAAPTATVEMSKGYQGGGGLGRANMQEYQISQKAPCRGWKRLAFFSWVSGKPVSKPIPAGQLQIFQVQATDLSYRRTSTCVNRFSFAPIPNHNYVFRQVAVVGDSCRTNVVDQTSGAPPPDFCSHARTECPI